MKKAFIEGKKVYLRTIGTEDLTDVYRDWLNDSEICLFNSHHRFPNYDENMKEYYERIIKSRTNLILAIVDRGTDRHIGNVALQDIDFLNQNAELAVIIGDKDFWSRGVGYDACSLIMTHGFTELNLHRMYCGTFGDNVGMQKLALKLGFKPEGISRGQVFKNGSFKDVIRYGILRHEFKV
ncbi:MAG: GNAT family protein [bacterium]|nr:GNAT family protein [bacterium]